MPRTASLLILAGLLGACTPSEVTPPPSLADQLATSLEGRTDAVAVRVGETEQLGELLVAVARIGPDGVDLSLATPGGEASTSSLDVGEQARLGSLVVRLVDVAADTVWVVPDGTAPAAEASPDPESG